MGEKKKKRKSVWIWFQFRQFQAYAYFSQAICPIPIYTTGCRTSCSCRVLLPVKKKSVLEEKPISSSPFVWMCFALAPVMLSAELESGEGAGRRPPGQPRGEGRALEAQDLECRLSLLDPTILAEFSSSACSSEKWKQQQSQHPPLNIASLAQLYHNSNTNDDSNYKSHRFVCGRRWATGSGWKDSCNPHGNLSVSFDTSPRLQMEGRAALERTPRRSQSDSVEASPSPSEDTLK